MKPARILIVDDERLIRLNLRALLEDLGYEVAEAGNGREALACLDEVRPDIVLTDLRMPEMGGPELIAELKGRAPGLPVIVISGTGSVPEAIAAVRLGAWDYLTKPVEEAEGVEIVIERALERARMLADSRNYQTRLEEMVRDRTRALAESEARYRRLLESVTCYVYTVTFRDGRPATTRHRPGCEALSGFTPNDYAADPDLWYQMVHEDDRRLVLNQARAIERQKRPVSFECRIRHKNGSLRWIENTLVPNLDAAGELLSYDGIVNDITARKQAEEAQLLSERRFRTLLENIRLVAVILDPVGRVTFCNDFFLELTGWSRGQVIGCDWFERFLPPETRDTLRGDFHLGIESGRVALHAEQTVVTRDGRELIVVCDNTLLHDPGKAVVGVATIGIDVTAHRLLEEELRHSQKMEAIGTLAGCVAHDFNNILTVILTCCLVMRDKTPDSDPRAGYLEQVKAAAERAVQLTRSLLAFSRKQPMIMQAVDLNDIVRELESFLTMLLGAKIVLAAHCRQSALKALADRSQVEQVLMNLAANARDAMPAGGTLSVDTDLVELDQGFVESRGYGLPGAYGLIRVADTGQGMDEQTRKRIFEPYFTTKEKGKGTGLGLSIVYGIIKQHNGYIEVQSEPGQGTVFSIYLPIIPDSQRTLGLFPPARGDDSDSWPAVTAAGEDGQVP
jgi:PAS domain S-box-containing protein